MTSLLTLNIANPPKARAEALLHWLWPRPEDVFVLTEVGAGEGSRLIQAVCRRAGHAVSATDPSELGVLVVRRDGELEQAPVEPLPLLPGRLASVRLPGLAPLRLLGVYGAASDPVRYSNRAQRARKRDWLTGFDRLVADWAGQPRGVLLGDLNIVDPQHTDTLKYVLPQETAFYRDLTDRHGLRDAFREHHPSGEAVSWVDHGGLGCRYDHAFVTSDLDVRSCDLVHEPRLEGLTDHSALVLELDAPDGGAPA